MTKLSVKINEKGDKRVIINMSLDEFEDLIMRYFEGKAETLAPKAKENLEGLLEDLQEKYDSGEYHMTWGDFFSLYEFTVNGEAMKEILYSVLFEDEDEEEEEEDDEGEEEEEEEEE